MESTKEYFGTELAILINEENFKNLSKYLEKKRTDLPCLTLFGSSFIFCCQHLIYAIHTDKFEIANFIIEKSTKEDIEKNRAWIIHRKKVYILNTLAYFFLKFKHSEDSRWLFLFEKILNKNALSLDFIEIDLIKNEFDTVEWFPEDVEEYLNNFNEFIFGGKFKQIEDERIVINEINFIHDSDILVKNFSFDEIFER